jgi:hypothetical protein
VILSGIVVGIFRYQKLSEPLRLVTILLLITFISEAIGRVLAWSIRNSSPVYHFYSPLECLLLLLIFSRLTRRKSNKYIIKYTFVGLILWSVLNSLFLQGFYEFNSNIDIIKMPATFCIASIIVFEMLEPSEQDNSIFTSEMIIIISVLWFNIAAFIFYVSYNYLLKSGVDKKTLNLVHFVSNIVYYLLLLVAVSTYKAKKEINYER